MKYDNRLVSTLLSYPLTWAAVLTVVVIEWGLIGWFQPSLIIKVFALGVGLLLLLMWPILLINSKTFAQLYYAIPNQMKTEDLEKLEELESDLDKLGSAHGVEQLRKLREKLESLTEVLKRRLDAGELTYGRYLGAAEQVYLSAVGNLRDVTVALSSVSTVEPGYIDKRLSELRKIGESTDEHAKEIATLEQRRSLFDQQMKRVSDLLAQNEAAMTVLVNTATALADTATGKGRVSVDAEAAMAELEMLAKRAGKYAATARAQS